MIVDSAFYLNGARILGEISSSSLDYLNEHPGSFAWIGLAQPNEDEIKSVLGSFELHETAIEDALQAQQGAKLEENGEVLTFVIRTVFYDDSKSSISTGELICFIHARFIIIVRHGDGAPLVTVRSELEASPEFLVLGTYAVLHGVLSKVIDEHNENWEATFRNMIRMSSGLVFFSCATTGRPEHGTRRTSPSDAPFTLDYYKNLTEQDFRDKFTFDEFELYNFSTNNDPADLYFWGIKKLR